MKRSELEWCLCSTGIVPTGNTGSVAVTGNPLASSVHPVSVLIRHLRQQRDTKSVWSQTAVRDIVSLFPNITFFAVLFPLCSAGIVLPQMTAP